jgi:hypothetical protein
MAFYSTVFSYHTLARANTNMHVVNSVLSRFGSINDETGCVKDFCAV